MSKNGWGEELLDAPPVHVVFGREREPREGEAVAEAQAETRALHGAEIAIDDVRLVDEWVLGVESEELVV